jgi:hypothetical protein
MNNQLREKGDFSPRFPLLRENGVGTYLLHFLRTKKEEEKPVS